MHFGRHMALGLTRFLPPWLASFAIAWVFWLLLLQPERFGWESAAAFQTMLFAEMGIVVAALFILPATGERSSVPSGLLICVVLGIFLAPYTSALVAFLIMLHLAARMAVSWRDPTWSRRQLRRVGVSLGALAMAWATAGLFWAFEGAWSNDVVPLDLWWQVPSPRGTVRIPHGFPVFGVAYFSLLTGVEGAAAVFRVFRRDTGGLDAETESA